MSARRDDEKRVRLPSSGLAEEILAGLRGEAGDAEPQGGEASGATAGDLEGPERIYLFADRLQAEAEDDAEERGEVRTWVAFRLGGLRLALPVSHAREVVRPGDLTPVPGAPAPVLGVTNLRGRPLPVVDLGARLGIETAAASEASRVVVLETRGRLVGLLVDAAEQVLHLEMNQALPPDDASAIAAADLVGVVPGERPLHLLDADRLLILPADEPGPAGPES